MNEHLNARWHNKDRFTVQQRRNFLWWTVIAVCLALLGLTGWMLWR